MSVRVQGAQRGVYGGFGVVDGVRSLVVGKTVHGRVAAADLPAL